MKQLNQIERPGQKTIPEMLSDAFLLPGETVCNLLKVEDPDSRMLFRMFVNLSIYGKIAVLLALVLF